MEGKKKINSVFIISVVIVLAIALWGLFLPNSFAAVANFSFSALTTNFGWLYTLSMTIFVVFCIWIGFLSKYKNMRLGPDDSRPEYSNIAWFAMLFSAGMGVGLVFWGVAEPLNFFVNPLDVEGGSGGAMKFAFSKAFLHWGIHPWANYTVLALALAYMQFRKGKPGLISSVFIPLIGEERVNGWIGKLIDILALFATVGGVSTSLGLGVMQITSGMNYLMHIPVTNMLLVGTAVVLAIIYIITAVAGVDKGISLVSNLNIIIAGVVMLVLFLVGPTVTILNNLVEGTGAYLSSIVSNTFSMGAFGNSGWYGGWTIYYWAWWISWAPFTGSFIARISKGRTIKEFVTGVLFLPAIASMVWFSIFGTLGINLGLDTATEAIKSTSTALFAVVTQYPMGTVIAFVILVLICTFFITSANSATFVLGMYSEGGTLNPSNKSKVIWGVLMAALALALMLASENGLSMLQTISIVAGLPFAIIMDFTVVSMIKAFKKENVAAIDAAYNASVEKTISAEATPEPAVTGVPKE